MVLSYCRAPIGKHESYAFKPSNPVASGTSIEDFREPVLCHLSSRHLISWVDIL
jgi:hypothetical protein